MNQLRIIAGQWRGRKIRFADAKGLRPTPDRVRETLFNWLQMDITGARCLDLFAGSGALGLEALSRGAAYCAFVEQQAAAAKAITVALDTLSCSQARCYNQSALEFLNDKNKTGEQAFDVVFLDPPYAFEHYERCYALLESEQWLSMGAYIYIEAREAVQAEQIPSNWHLHRAKRTGNVHYHLIIRD